jgi:UDP-glucose 4-epimerase
MQGTWLITGAAGYIGRHVVQEFTKNEFSVICLDNLSFGLRETIPPNIPFYEIDILDRDNLKKVFYENAICGIIHLAGLKSVEESMSFPEKYYSTNTQGTKNLLEAAREFEVTKFIFSSTAAVYGGAKFGTSPLSETDELNPISHYGNSKLKAEVVLHEASDNSNLKHVSLRYFNVAGSSSRLFKDTSTENLIPKVINSLKTGSGPMVYGSNYPTPDGTCIRDFIHVEDLAHAHMLAAQKLDSSSSLPNVMNIGSGGGYSVLEVINCIKEELQIYLPNDIHPPRNGDLPFVVADTSVARSFLDFFPRMNLSDMIKSSVY